MKQRMLKCIVGLLVLIMAIPIIPGGSIVAEAAAPKPTLSISKKTIVGTGATYTISVKNAGKNVTKYKWYSTNNKIAKVQATKDPAVAKVTTVGKGSAYIKCGVFYKDGTIRRPYSQVTVQIPVTSVKITNALDNEENNNRHVIAVGETFDFNATKTPSNASEKLYYFLGNSGETYAKVDAVTGKVTGVKPGFVVLRVAAGMTKDAAANSKIDDAINIEIVEKTTKVNSVDLTDSTTLKVTFSSAIDPDTVIGKDKKLKDSVVIMAKTDEKNNTAKGLGEITATLSNDGKVLTIQTQYNFNGIYGLILTSDVKGKDKSDLQPFSKTLKYYDTIGPSFIKYTTDETGLKATIHFSEAVNFSKMDIIGARALSSKVITATTTNTLLQVRNYVVSEDRKSLTIDLTNMDPVDQNKIFEIQITGITDIAGNVPPTYPLRALLKTDTTPKPQARLLNIARTSYDTLTATFDRPIKTVGTLTISGSYEMPAGVVDKEDSRKVNYKLSTASAQLTGMQTVTIQYWDSYNVSINDTTAYTGVSRQVNFTSDKTVPQLIKSELGIETINNVDVYKLVLTYNKNVEVLYPRGILNANIVTSNNDRYSNKPLSFTAVAKDKEVTLLLNSNEILYSGTYMIEIPEAFVRDTYWNRSNKTTITVLKNAAVSSNLPAPRLVQQAPDDNNIIEVYFGVKVDETTAQNVANYNIPGVSIVSATLKDNNDVDGARIELRVQSGTIIANTAYYAIISGITGYHNTYSAMDTYQTPIYLRENVTPAVISADFSYPGLITLTFTEDITGSPSFKVTQGGIDLGGIASIVGNKVMINLSVAPNINNQPILLEPTQNNVIKDANGNAAIITIRNIPVKY